MKTAALVIAALVAAEHLYILYLEMFAWRGRARAVFGTTKEQANLTAVLAANQGAYNGLISVGLACGIFWDDPRILLLFMGFVAGAAAFGATSAKPQILAVQGGPAILGLVVLFMAGPTFWWQGFVGAAVVFAVSAGLGVIVKRREDELESQAS